MRRFRSRAAGLALLAALLAFVAGCGGQTSTGATEIRIPLGAGGVGFLPLLVMRDLKLIEKHASAAGLASLRVRVTRDSMRDERSPSTRSAAQWVSMPSWISA